MLILGGCYASVGVGYYPTINQQSEELVDPVSGDITPARDVTTTGFSALLNLGFYFDMPMRTWHDDYTTCQLGCSPVSVGVGQGATTVAPPDDTMPLQRSDALATELRLDVDLPWHLFGFKLRGTGIYGVVGEAEIKTSSHADSKKIASDGYTFAAGLTFSNKANWLSFTLAGVRVAMENEAAFHNGDIPPTRVRALGVQFRVTVALTTGIVGFVIPFFKYRNEAPGWSSSGTNTKKTVPGNNPRTPTCRTVTECRTGGPFGRRCQTRKVCE
jgi:hypothetical protein